MSSYATVTTSSMEMSPVQVTYNGVDLGGTLGNVTVDFKYAKGEIHADQFGSTVLDRVTNGVEVKVTTEIAEIKDKAIWAKIFPNATLIVDGSDKTIHWTDRMTAKDSAAFNALVLHPLANDSGVVDHDYTFFKAVPSEESSITYGPNEQARLKIVWNIYPDTSVQPASFFKYGDTTI